MAINRVIGRLLLLGALFLTACSAAVGLADPRPVDEVPSAADINAAAERAAVEEATVPLATIAEEQPAETETPRPTPTIATTETAEPAPTEGPRINPRVEVPDDLFVNWLIPRDGIRPIYNPEFSSAAEAPLDDGELIIGISFDDEAKAYPISVLRSREMVNDELAGIPTLVTW